MLIPIHSNTDLITNSSTTIFTYSGGAEKFAKEMINEFFKTFGIDKKCEDVFNTVILCDSDEYSEHDEFIPEGLDTEDIDRLYENIISGKIQKPEWFKEVEEKENDYNNFPPNTFLHLIPKKEEYKNLGNLIQKFLYSTEHDGVYDG